jgi:hypothetical protein
METMEHIFDDRHTLQSMVVMGGNKVAVSPESGRHSIRFEDAERIFFLNFSELQSEKIKKYLHPKTNNTITHEAIVVWCNEVLGNTLKSYRGFDLNGRVSLRELFIERIVSVGSAEAIIFLHKFYYRIKQ